MTRKNSEEAIFFRDEDEESLLDRLSPMLPVGLPEELVRNEAIDDLKDSDALFLEPECLGAPNLDEL